MALKAPPQKLVLKDGDKVVVVGGGPSGAFFAIHLLRESRKAGRFIEVDIIEKKRPLESDGEPWFCKGCNYCAGGISPRLSRILEENQIRVPQELICEEFSCLWIQGLWKNFPLEVPADTRLFSVFRGSLPPNKEGMPGGFDGFLLKEAVSEGATLVPGDAQSIEYSSSGLPRVITNTEFGETQDVPASFVAVSAGINSDFDQEYSKNELFKSISRLNPRFIPAKVRKALIFELEVGRGYLNKYMHKELYFVEYWFKDLMLEHVALIPKGEYLTIVLIGKSIDEASLRRENRKIINKFFTLPHIKRILPGINMNNTPIACTCFPWLTIGTAKEPYADRLALLGDTVGSRLYKDGLYSAYFTAIELANTVLNEGIDRWSIASRYGKTMKWLAKDTKYGKLVFTLSGLNFSAPILSRIIYQASATELKFKEKGKRPLCTVLWKIASGSSDYHVLFKEMFSFSVLRSILLGGVLLTIRNILTEILLGIKWGEYGRYPTVILKENRGTIKEEISSSLTLELDEAPDFERMYAIKIRAAADEIFNELSKYGDETRSFLKMRFADVDRISGQPNTVGSVIRYTVWGLRASADLVLTRCVPNKTILYEVSERFARRGKLIFDVHPTSDGNNQFVIYTAFDFRRGKGIFGKLFWRLFKLLFPAYIHDVVWNHALCSIKEEVEGRV